MSKQLNFCHVKKVKCCHPAAAAIARYTTTIPSSFIPKIRFDVDDDKTDLFSKETFINVPPLCSHPELTTKL